MNETNQLNKNQLRVTMLDGSIYRGTIQHYPHGYVPFWLRCDENPVSVHFAYIRTATNQSYALNLISDYLLPTHVPVIHGPKSVWMRLENNEYYAANNFNVYPIHEHNHFCLSRRDPGNLPENNHIYISVPHDQVYRSLLQGHM